MSSNQKNMKFNDEWIKMPKWRRQKGEMAFKHIFFNNKTKNVKKREKQIIDNKGL